MCADDPGLSNYPAKMMKTVEVRPIVSDIGFVIEPLSDHNPQL